MAPLPSGRAANLTIFDKTQEVYGVRKHLAMGFGVPEENATGKRIRTLPITPDKLL